MQIRIEGFVVGSEDAVHGDEATIIVVPLKPEEYKNVDIGVVSAGCKKAFTFNTEELFGALCSAMTMRRQAQESKTNETRWYMR